MSSQEQGIPFNPSCTRCERINRNLVKIRSDYPDYHAAPVAPFGDSTASLVIVGLGPGMHGANATGRPFTGDHAGILLYQMLHKYGFGNKPVSNHADDGLKLMNCRITNAVKCLPPGNKPLGAEIKNCNGYLRRELYALEPGDVILALGRIAHEAIIRALELKQKDYPFGHHALHKLPENRLLLDSYHCSRYNTQTGRLTETMFNDVFKTASTLLNG
jgi:uracil-DNA glycosylase family 4